MIKIMYSWLLMALVAWPGYAQSQIINPQKVLERKVNNKINRAIDKKAGQVVDSAFKPVEATNQNPEKARTPLILISSRQQPGRIPVSRVCRYFQNMILYRVKK